MRKSGVLAAVVLFCFTSSAWAEGEDEEQTPAVDEAAATEATKEVAEPEAEPVEEEQPAPPAEEEPVEQPAPPAEGEQESLEADMEAAKEKINTSSFEEITATPVGDEPAAASSSDDGKKDNRPASVRLSEARGDKPWGLTVVMDHSLGTGGFMANSTLNGTRAYFAQNWDIRPSYTFDFMDHKLKVMGRFLFELELTTPDGTEGRHFKPSDTSVYLVDSNLYTEPFTEIQFDGGLRYFFPTSYESINVTGRWGALSLFGGASRTFGPVYVKYSFGFTKNFHSNPVGTVPSDVPQRGWNGAALADPGLAPTTLNTNFSITNTFVVTYNFSDNLSASYSLLIWNVFGYDMDNVNVVDELTSPNADDGVARADMLWPTLDVTYVLDEVLEPVVVLPFSLMLSAGITALHPAQTSDNSGIRWPFFYTAFLDDQAANNWGQFYFDITGVY